MTLMRFLRTKKELNGRPEAVGASVELLRGNARARLL